MDRKSEIAAALRGRRSERGITQAELAESIGRNPSTVSSWENTGCISLADAVDLARFYGISVTALTMAVAAN